MSKLRTIIGDGWDNQLSSFFDQGKFDQIKEKIKGTNFYPKGSDVFKPFNLCKWEDVKIVIIDEYPSDVSNGLAYGIKEDTFIELKETTDIMLNIELAYDQFLINKFDETMEWLAKQGVLLLNYQLTDSFNMFGGKLNHWVEFSDLVIKSLNENKTGLIWVLWNETIRNKLLKIINPKTHYIISDNIKPDHFIQINNLINKQNGSESTIKWY